ncbi:endolytic transglycosylase MltG [Candidatus Peregrinibacteria bacterium]|nr:endolytic transglycosylase MltG [Candidatus Peregrinibacteria bacterium]MBT4148512.1 endolytic transglycosylase MltG [Candidatus Peregrinibacteria bacterium]MBT4366707.1 endolytic transglycosylase MltG [Candidatus Peregrinibacteria bacterium]MBT4455524.1 endolytic transglycosylase MltG [Candidatus Peregrinibacteria bacterium]
MNKSQKQYRRYVYGIIGFFIAAIAANTFRYYNSINSAPDPENTEEVSFLIKQGESIETIGKNLEDSELIKSSWAFYWYIRLNNIDEDIISGRFMINQSMTTKEITQIISDASKSEAILTIQEGLRIKDIDTRLTESELIESGAFTKATQEFKGYEYYYFLPAGTPLEGYLFPDTYFLNAGDFKPDEVIYKALDNFENKIQPLVDQITQSGKSFEDIIIMASIIEKEVISQEDKSLVSGILWKRIDSGWRLDADATLLYTKDDNKITSADLSADSPYNSRKVQGLPPTPICNPSLSSIEAAINPKSSNYWFYLSTPEGETIFATSNEDHNTNKAKYL